MMEIISFFDSLILTLTEFKKMKFMNSFYPKEKVDDSDRDVQIPHQKHDHHEWMIDPKHWHELFFCVLILSPITTLASLYFIPDEWRFITYLDLAVALFSISYWYHPVKGWRRNIDMAMVICALTYHYYLMIQYSQYWIFPIYVISHWTPYFMSWYSTTPRHAVYWWILLHFISHIGNAIFYCMFFLV